MNELEALEAAAAQRRRNQTSSLSSAPTATAPAAPSPQNQETAPGAKGWLASLNSIEKLSLAGCAAVVLIAGIVFLKYLHAYPWPEEQDAIPAAFEVPVKGQLVTLSAVETYWRNRQEGDNAQSQEKVIPIAKLTLNGDSSAKGFVRVEFLDSDRKIRGDIAVLTVEGGKFQDTSNGEKISADGLQAEVAGTVGFQSETLFGSYLIEDEPSWVLRLREGADYTEGPWSVLGSAEISNEKR